MGEINNKLTELAKEALASNEVCSTWKEKIKEALPKFQVKDKWYTDENQTLFVCRQHDDYGYGWYRTVPKDDWSWRDRVYWSIPTLIEWRECTPDEVKKMFEEEVDKRGLHNVPLEKDALLGEPRIVKNRYNSYYALQDPLPRIYGGYGCIYSSGTWAIKSNTFVGNEIGCITSIESETWYIDTRGSESRLVYCIDAGEGKMMARSMGIGCDNNWHSGKEIFDKRNFRPARQNEVAKKLHEFFKEKGYHNTRVTGLYSILNNTPLSITVKGENIFINSIIIVSLGKIIRKPLEQISPVELAEKYGFYI
jgi:hypothetical protein